MNRCEMHLRRCQETSPQAGVSWCQNFHPDVKTRSPSQHIGACEDGAKVAQSHRPAPRQVVLLSPEESQSACQAGTYRPSRLERRGGSQRKSTTGEMGCSATTSTHDQTCMTTPRCRHRVGDRIACALSRRTPEGGGR